MFCTKKNTERKEQRQIGRNERIYWQNVIKSSSDGRVTNVNDCKATNESKQLRKNQSTKKTCTQKKIIYKTKNNNNQKAGH